MVDQGIDLNGLRDLEAKITGKASQIQKNTDVLRSESDPLINENDSESLTQLEMNQRAAKRFENAKHKMQEAIAGIDSRVGDDRSQALMQSQAEWESYSVSQAESAASSYKSGSIYPLIYYSELESLTNERTARLQAELDELIRLGN